MIQNFQIVGFRNYADNFFASLGEKTVILGPNGSGKTNLLEAIAVWLTGESFRTHNLADAIQWGGKGFSLRGVYQHDEYQFGYTPTARLYKKNTKTVTAEEYRRNHPVVVFLPEDPLLLYGGPEGRRRLLDTVMNVLDKDYRSLWLEYFRVLRQRNAHLRTQPEEAHIWDRKLMETGSALIEKRFFYLRQISLRLQESFYELYNIKIELRMLNTFRVEKTVKESFFQALEESKKLERQKHMTLVGPHRDTFEIRSEDKNFRNFASQGQKRAAALLFKLSVASLLRDASRVPLLLFDDVMLEMDYDRQKLLLNLFWDSFPWIWTIYSRDLIPGPKSYDLIQLPLSS